MRVLRKAAAAGAAVGLSWWVGANLATKHVIAVLPAECSAAQVRLTVSGFEVFSPWAFFQLQAQCKQFAPRAFQIGFLMIVLACVAGGAANLCLAYLAAPRKTKDHVFGTARWANRSEIADLQLFSDVGVFLGRIGNRFLRHDGPEHYAVIAPTRSGKGAGVVVPTLLTWTESAIVYDLKEENWKVTAGRRSEFSDVVYFNPNSEYSAHFNPLLEVRPGLSEVRDVQNLANMIIEPERPGMSDHWIRTGNALLTAAILHVLYTSAPESKNLAGVTAFLSQGDKTLRDTLLEMIETKHLRDPVSGIPTMPHPGIVAAARDVLNKSPDDMSSVHSTIMGFLSLYRDPLLAHNTRDSDFCIRDLMNRDRPVTLYLVIPPSDIERLRPLIRLMVNQICRRLTEPDNLGESSVRKHRLLLMLDEFPALGRLEFFESALGFIAGFGLKAMLICQSMNQLKATYGERTSILDNTHVRVFFTPNTFETAEYISKSLGQSTVQYSTEAHSGKVGAPFFTGKSAADHVGARALLTPREVMELPQAESMIFLGGSRPILAAKVRYFEDRALTPLLKGSPRIESGSPVFGFGRAGESDWFSEKYTGGESIEEPLGAQVEVSTADDVENAVLVIEPETVLHPGKAPREDEIV